VWIWCAIAAGTCGVACGGDDDANDDGAVEGDGTLGTSSSDASTSGESSGGVDDASSSDDGITTSSDGADAATTGGTEDPSYPMPDAADECPDDAASIQLQGGSVCTPFCAGEDAACPAPSSGDAPPICTPFFEPGGSGTMCVTHDQCRGEEACDYPPGTCATVGFWACVLKCDTGQTCSDGMTCIAGECGYP
jgi:hypothetical protein